MSDRMSKRITSPYVPGRVAEPPFVDSGMLGEGTKQRTYQSNSDTPAILRDLRAAFGLTTDSAVIRRALALARVIVRAAQGGDTIVVRKPDGGELEIVLRG